jgi:hypothetical protein
MYIRQAGTGPLEYQRTRTIVHQATTHVHECGPLLGQGELLVAVSLVVLLQRTVPPPSHHSRGGPWHKTSPLDQPPGMSGQELRAL